MNQQQRNESIVEAVRLIRPTDELKVISLKGKSLKTAIEKMVIQAKPDLFRFFLISVEKKKEPSFQALLTILTALLKKQNTSYIEKFYELFKNNIDNYEFLNDVLTQLAALKDALRFFGDDENLKITPSFEWAKDSFKPIASVDVPFNNYQNLSWLYEKAYFLDSVGKLRSSTQVEKLNEMILRKKFDENGNNEKAYKDTYLRQFGQSFCLKVGNRGLVTGTGTPHESGMIDEEFKLGFGFESLFGLPIINASGIKGAIRSVFPAGLREKARSEGVQKNNDYLIQQADILLEHFQEEIFPIWLKKCVLPSELKCNEGFLRFLEWDIFENATLIFEENKIKDNKKKSVNNWNIFHEAFVYKSDSKRLKKNEANNNWIIDESKSNLLFDDHVITNERVQFKSPNIVKFLKVSSGVVFKFQFNFVDTQYKGFKISAQAKAELMKIILLDVGLGAKTRVGLGQFTQYKAINHA